jgi:WD40 repeat protein
VEPVAAQELELPYLWAGIAWSPDSQCIAVGTLDGLYIHSASDLSVIREFAMTRLVNSLSWHPDGQYLAYTATEHIQGEPVVPSVYLLDVESGTETPILQDIGYLPFTVNWSPDGNLLALVVDETIVLVVDPLTSEIVFEHVAVQSDGAVFPSIAWSPSSDAIAFTSYSQSEHSHIEIWELDTLTLQNTLLSFGDLVQWSAAENLLGTNAADFELWDPNTGELAQSIEVGGYFDVFALNPSGELLGTHTSHCANERCTAMESQIEIRSVSSAEIMRTISGEFNSQYPFRQKMQFSPNGEYLAYASDGYGTIYLWRTDTWEEVARYEGYRNMRD